MIYSDEIRIMIHQLLVEAIKATEEPSSLYKIQYRLGPQLIVMENRIKDALKDEKEFEDELL